MKITGRKASLYATAMAISLVALSGTAHSATANGQYKASALPAAEGVGGTKSTSTTATLTQAQIDAKNVSAADKVILAKKNAVTAELLGSLSTASSSAYAALKAATADETAKIKARDIAAAKLNGGTVAGVTYASATLAKSDADSLVSTLAGTKSSADGAVSSANTALTSAVSARAALAAGDPGIATADALVARRTQELKLATVEASTVTTAYNAAVSAASTATAAFTAAVTAVADTGNALTTSTAVKSNAGTTLATALGADTGFAATLAAVKLAAADSTVTAFTADAAGLAAIELYDNQTLATPYGSNGYTRTTAALAAGAASANANIVMATAALTDGAAALEAGANFETEVLSVLVNHETRITTNATNIAANTTAIAALDVRTTANTTAIAALDVRTTANTTAIANEVTARVAADNALGARITTETNERIAADNVLRDQIASSTATAIAMGGAALLPDMGFTLSGNIAVYEGAQAMALNAAAKVGPNAYVTAAVGGGLNKNGSVGGRVGFVFGF